MNEELKNKIHELDILTEELSSLRPNATVYAKKVPSSRVLFRENKTILTEIKRKELVEAKEALVAIPNQAHA
ncbi:hypothetical protein BCR41DRAFT_353521 [Lobosporangium transversale]|uniref:Prefoldin n=1 Tax=Lobosporangium transversale TaxID=64571 RepID=A0A1Y2GPJ6_9FUNG|nr:hypothetical protein BCR41DRAFT_353521 [Lobosporangium transversale]ORZ16102.1 hypothetical protein BCR41DRAFT_353521 [Lobosporangium transversale]|eukprot:XP_021881449.1 hypothetical protein BCR41DRAFT_353521 [Lobosporangium transversale]